jgi:hypothetical protein
MALHLADAVADAVPLVLRDRRQDSEHQLGNAVAAHVATEVDHVQTYAVRLQFLKRAESVGHSRAGQNGDSLDTQRQQAERKARSRRGVMITSASAPLWHDLCLYLSALSSKSPVPAPAFPHTPLRPGPMPPATGDASVSHSFKANQAAREGEKIHKHIFICAFQ